MAKRRSTFTPEEVAEMLMDCNSDEIEESVESEADLEEENDKREEQNLVTAVQPASSPATQYWPPGAWYHPPAPHSFPPWKGSSQCHRCQFDASSLCALLKLAVCLHVLT